MRRTTTFAALMQVPSATLNAMQDEQTGLIHANQNNGFSAALGEDGRVWQAAANLADATERLIDDSINWRDRLVELEYLRFAAGGADLPGGASDYNFPYAFIAGAQGTYYLGSGAYSAAGGAISSGTPPAYGPLPGPVTGYAILLEVPGPGTGVWLYCKAADATGKLYLYNDLGGGAVFSGFLRWRGSGPLGFHP